MPLPPAPIDSFRRWSADKWARTTGALVDTLSEHGWDLGAEDRISQIAQPLPEPEPLPAPEPPPPEAQIPPSPLPAPEPEPSTPPAPSFGARVGGAFSGLGTRVQGALSGARDTLSGAGDVLGQQAAAQGQAAGDWVDQAQNRISDLGGTLGDLNEQATTALDTAASDYQTWRDSGGPRPSLGDQVGGLVSGFLPDRGAIGANLGRQLAGQPLAFDAASQAAGASFREPLQRATEAVEEPFIGFAQSMGSPDYPRLDREQAQRLVESTTEQIGGMIDPAAGLQTAAPEGLDLARRAAPEAGEAAPGLFRGLGERVRELPYRFGRALEEEYGSALGVLARNADEIEARAAARFGKTRDMAEAGYIQRDGSLLDMSGKSEGGTPGMRSYDHRQVGEFLDAPLPEGGTAQMHRFMEDTGAVRMDGQGPYLNIQIPAGLSPRQRALILSRARDFQGAVVEVTDAVSRDADIYGAFDFPQDFRRFNQMIRSVPEHIPAPEAEGGLGIARAAEAGDGFDLGAALRQGTSPFMGRAAQTTGERAFDIASGTAGGVAGAATAPEDATWQERAMRGLEGAAMGALGGAHLRGLARVTGRALGPEAVGIAGRGADDLAESRLAEAISQLRQRGLTEAADDLARYAVGKGRQGLEYARATLPGYGVRDLLQRPAVDLTRGFDDAARIDWRTSRGTGAMVDQTGRVLGPDDVVEVYHATDPDTAARLVEQGVQPGGKVAREPTRIESDDVAKMLGKRVGDTLDDEPGRGLSEGFYVGANPHALSPYGDAVVGVRVRLGDLLAPAERKGLTPDRALLLDDAQLTRPIDPADVRLLTPGTTPPKRGGGVFGIAQGQGDGIPPVPGTARRFIGKSPLERLPEAHVPEGAGDIRLSPTKEGERLRLDQFPEWAREPIRKGAEEANWFRAQRRGVIPDDLAASMADDAQKSVQDWIKTGRAGKVLNTEETRALANAIAGQAKVVSDLSAQVDAAKQAGGVTDRMVTQLFTEGEKLQALTAIREGGRAEWGRAGRAWQAAAKAIDLPPSEAAERIFSKVGGRDRAQELLSQYQGLLESGATPTQLARFWSQVEHGPVKAGDWLHLLRYNAMLSGVPTMMVNMLGSATELGQKGAMDVASSLARGQARELAPEARGAFAGMGVGARRFMQTLREGITSEEALAGGLPRSVSARVTNPAARRVATALEVPGRLQGATDELMNSLAYGMSAGRRAAQRATEGGLAGDAWRQEVARLMDDLPADLSKRAQHDADRLTFRNPLPEKGIGAGIAKGRQVIPGGTFLVPFYKTVANITSRGVERSPLGALGTTFDVLRRRFPHTPFGAGPYEKALNDSLKIKEGVTPLGERVANNVLGSAAFGYFASQAMAGNISAEGPRDTRQREVLRAQGWQPYSVKLGDRWLSYSNLGPWAIPLALAGSVGEAERYGQAGEQWYEHMDDVVRGTGALLADQPYMAGIGAIYKAFDDPERYGTQWLSQTLGSLVPFGGALNTVASATDPYQRQATAEGGPVAQALGQVATRVPGLRQGQPVARDVFGNPVRNPRADLAGVGALNPVRFAPTPARETRELRRFVGARSAAEDARIAAAIRHVEDFDAGRTGVPPRREELRLYDQFAGSENPEYTDALRGGRELSRTERVERERRASGAPPGP